MAVPNEEIYYIEALGEASTYIGRHSIMPNLPPVEFTEKEYKAHRAYIEHYRNAGVISVAEPGSREAILMHDAITREKERMAGIFAVGNEDEEPDPVLRKRGFSVSEKYADKRVASGKRTEIPAFAISPSPSDDDLDYKCLAVTARGDRCKNSAMGSLLVCTVHNSSLKRGKTVKDSQGRNISSDGKSFEAE